MHVLLYPLDNGLSVLKLGFIKCGVEHQALEILLGALCTQKAVIYLKD